MDQLQSSQVIGRRLWTILLMGSTSCGRKRQRREDGKDRSGRCCMSPKCRVYNPGEKKVQSAGRMLGSSLIVEPREATFTHNIPKVLTCGENPKNSVGENNNCSGFTMWSLGSGAHNTQRMVWAPKAYPKSNYKQGPTPEEHQAGSTPILTGHPRVPKYPNL